MYPLKAKTISETLGEAEAKLNTIRDGLRGAILALEVERHQISQAGADALDNLNGILGLGVLLNELQGCRSRAQAVLAALPSPNKVGAKTAARVAAVMRLGFETVEHTRNIQAEVYRLARLNLRSACHKMK